MHYDTSWNACFATSLNREAVTELRLLSHKYPDGSGLMKVSSLNFSTLDFDLNATQFYMIGTGVFCVLHSLCYHLSNAAAVQKVWKIITWID